MRLVIWLPSSYQKITFNRSLQSLVPQQFPGIRRVGITEITFFRWRPQILRPGYPSGHEASNHVSLANVTGKPPLVHRLNGDGAIVGSHVGKRRQQNGEPYAAGLYGWFRAAPLSARNTSIPVDANAYGDFSFSAHHQTRGESARDRGIPPPSLSSTIPSRTSDLPAQASSPGDARTNPSPPCRTHAPVHQRATAAPLSTITNAIIITPATARCRRRCPAPARPGRSRTQQPRRGQVESREQNIRHTRLNSRHKSDEYPSTTTFASSNPSPPHPSQHQNSPKTPYQQAIAQPGANKKTNPQ